MSIISTTANYGGRIVNGQNFVKQFFVANQSSINWIYKRLTSGLNVITPSDNTKDVYFDNNLFVKKDLHVEGSIYNPSDENLKDNILPVSADEMNDLLKINTVSFFYKKDKTKIKHFGVLAQEVENIFPQLVNTKNDCYKSVNYQELIPLMLSKIKQMQNEIDELKERVKK